jgi:hypothetical protein
MTLGSIMISNPFSNDSTMPEAPLLDGEEVLPKSPSAGKTSPAEQGLEVPMGWKPTHNEPVPVVRCIGTASTTGERCKRWSLRGTNVCRKHGAQLPNVRDHAEAVVESARLQLMGMADDAVEVLSDLMKAGVADAVRLKAAETVLTRAGIKDAISLDVEVTHNVSLSEDIGKRLEIMRQRQLAAAAEAEAAAELAEQEELIDEGEIVDEPEEA